VSLDAQRARIAAWVQGQGLASWVPVIYADEGISGKRADNRPGLKAALADVCGEAGVLVVYSLSRMARSVRDTLAIAERLEKAGADLVSLSESIDTTSATGKMVFRLLAVLAEFERDLISERTKGALALKRQRRERTGEVPYGMRLAADGVGLEIDRDELAVLTWILAEHAAGRGARAIARELSARGVATKRGGAWASSTIRRLVAEKGRVGK
jgi:DNA invertase Pin-like site-specific DNA recombinase